MSTEAEASMKRTLLAAALSLVTLSAQAEIKTEEIVYRVGDQEFTGYLAYDAAVEGKRPGVLVLHEWWGHNDYARERARMLAELGYTGFALDMYGTDKLADNPDAARGHMNDLMNVPGQVTERFEAAYALVRSHPTVDGERMGGSRCRRHLSCRPWHPAARDTGFDQGPPQGLQRRGRSFRSPGSSDGLQGRDGGGGRLARVF